MSVVDWDVVQEAASQVFVHLDEPDQFLGEDVGVQLELLGVLLSGGCDLLFVGVVSH